MTPLPIRVRAALTRGALLLALLAGCANGSDPDAAREAGVRMEIEQALRRDPVVNRIEVHVRVDEGLATLDGDVGTPEERERAEEIARATPGVRDVDNRLQVSEGGIQQRIPAAIVPGVPQ